MSLLPDTSVWSLAFRRDNPSGDEVRALTRALDAEESVATTGLILQELLQGFSGPKMNERILDRFASLRYLVPDRTDHVNAAELRNHCRRNGVQIGTIDALLAQLCIRHDLVMLSADRDFVHAARHCPLVVWQATSLVL
ncbi:MAG TPA: PIN domain-containing protein [Rhizomicrobium sp.]